MKKLVAITLAAVMALCLAGCTGMTKEEYAESSTVKYFTTGEFSTDLALLTSSLPMEEGDELDYEAWSRLEDKCEAIIGMENIPDECAEAHAELVKVANNVLGQIDMLTECAANMEVYRITGDITLITETTEKLNALESVHEQAISYVKSAKSSLG